MRGALKLQRAEMLIFEWFSIVFGGLVRAHGRGPEASKSRSVDFPMVFHCFVVAQ